MTVRKEAVSIDPIQLRVIIGKLALSGPLTIDRVARHLRTSPRSLQRQLTGRGETFRGLVGQIREETACILLCQTNLPVYAIAIRLGYRTPSSFARAFGRWSGLSPLAYRRANGNAYRAATWREMVRGNTPNDPH